MKVLCFGEILLRLTPPASQRILQAKQFEAAYGGSEANVAISLAQFGVATAYLTRVPTGPIGQAALHTLTQYGVSTDFAIRGGERLGVYFLEKGTGYRANKVVYDRSESGMATLAPGMLNWSAALENTSWLHWSGITPALSRQAADALMEGVEKARACGITVSCDLNYRSSLWNYGKSAFDVMPALVKQSDILLGDETAFQTCLGMDFAAETNPLHILERVKEEFPHLQFLAMTRREGFSATHNSYQGFIYDGRQLAVSRKYDLPDILDRIGAGDAFMAGLIFKLQKEPISLTEVIEFATAAAAWKHYVAGDFNICTREELDAVINGKSGGLVMR